MKKILFDSDVLIEYLRDNSKIVTEIELITGSNIILAVTPITEAEIRRGMRSHERQKTEEALGKFECLDLNRDVGKKAGEYLKRFGRTHGLELSDAFIAAAAFVHQFALCTFNWKHYPMTEILRYRIEV